MKTHRSSARESRPIALLALAGGVLGLVALSGDAPAARQPAELANSTTGESKTSARRPVIDASANGHAMSAINDRSASVRIPIGIRGIGRNPWTIADDVAAALGARVLSRYESFVIVRCRADVAVKIAEETGGEVLQDQHRILLSAGAVDTSVPQAARIAPAQGPPTSQAAHGEQMLRTLHLVQFVAPVQRDWLDQLMKTGVQIVSYAPSNAYIVYGDARSIERLRALAATDASVQWTGVYLDSYKIDPGAKALMQDAKLGGVQDQLFAIQLVQDAATNAKTLAVVDRLKSGTIKNEWSALNFRSIIVPIPPRSLAEIAARPDVIAIQPISAPVKHDERQAQILAGNTTSPIPPAPSEPSAPGYLGWLAGHGFTQAQFNASNFAIDITDSGFDNATTAPNHFGLYESGIRPGVSRVIYNRLIGTPNVDSTLKGCDGHGTLNAHVAMGYSDQLGFPFVDAEGFHYGLGVCPFVKAGSSVIFDPVSFTSPNPIELQSRAYNDSARISSNSWGDNSNNYTVYSQIYDVLVRDAQLPDSAFPTTGNQEMVIVFSAGNAGAGGPNTVKSPGTAKNVITVGASENVRAINGSDGCGLSDFGANNANDIAAYSSRGPCADGRMKPDLCAPGTHITGGTTQVAAPPPLGLGDLCFNAAGVCGGVMSQYFPPGQQYYTSSSGTSLAAPGVSGACALVRQFFINLGMNPPSPAMTKAMLMNGAYHLDGVGANDTLWSASQGMGRVNLSEVFNRVAVTPTLIRDQLTADTFDSTGQSRVFVGTIADSTKPFRVTLAWTDAPGTVAAAAYMNDLDLVVSVGGSTYKGNVFVGALSATGGIADTKNNVESVLLPAGLSGPFTVTVTAANINSDGLLQAVPSPSQDFALAIYNNGPACVAPAIVTHPDTQVACALSTVTLTASGSGGPTLFYQWRKNTVDISGATSATYVITSAGASDSGIYDCVISNICDQTATTDPATLSVVGTKCQPADIAWDDGTPLPPFSSCTFVDQNNSGVNEGDYNAFFQGFFEAAPQCDIAWDDGAPLPPFGVVGIADNNGVNEGDYNCFFQFFFNGCP